MVDYRKIIRLKSLNFSNVGIASSIRCSRNTVSEVLNLAQAQVLAWPIPESLTNRDIEVFLHPERTTNEGRKLPDYKYVYNELVRPGVTLALLLAEYCVKYEQENTIPYKHSQCNEKYHANAHFGDAST